MIVDVHFSHISDQIPTQTYAVVGQCLLRPVGTDQSEQTELFGRGT